MYKSHGALVKHEHVMEGRNSRLDALQAAILSVKLKYLPIWTSERQAAAAHYDDLLASIGEISIPLVRSNAAHVYHLYVIRTPRRDELKAHLADLGIQSRVHYPTALPMLPAYEYLRHVEGDFPNAVKAQAEILSIPIYPEIRPEQIEYVAQSIRQFFE